MRKVNFIKAMILVGILPLSGFINGDVTNPTQDKVIELTNDNGNGINEETLKIPVTATLSNDVLNVQFTGNVPIATVTVNNAQTGATISRQTMTATSGTVSMIPLPELTMGTVTVTNEVSGETVSGEFEVSQSKE